MGVLRDLLMGAVQSLPDLDIAGDWSKLSADNKQAVYDVLERFAPKVGDTSVLAVLTKLEDGSLSHNDVRDTVVQWVKSVPDLADDIKGAIEKLLVGDFGRDAAVCAVLHVAAGAVDDPRLRAFLKGLAGADLSRATLEKQVLGLLVDTYVDADLTQQLQRFLGGEKPKLTVGDVVDILAAGALGAKHATLVAVAKALAGSSTARLDKALTGFILERFPDDIAALVSDVLAKDLKGAVAKLLKLVDLAEYEQIARDILDGKTQAAAEEAVEIILAKVGVKEEHRAPLAKALIGLASGTRRLFALSAETGSPLKTDAHFALFREVREAICAAQWLCVGGPHVPTDPQAPYHCTLAASSIRWTTPLAKLVRPSATVKKDREAFAMALTGTLNQQFEGRLRSRFEPPIVSEKNLDPAKPDAQCLCGAMYSAVYWKLLDRSPYDA